MKKRFPIPENTTLLTKDGRASDANTITVELDYDKGGMSYFTYKEKERGYYLRVSATKVEQKDGWTSESFTLFATPGFSSLLVPVKRANPKVEQRLAAAIESLAEDIVTAFLASDSTAIQALKDRIVRASVEAR